MRAFDQTRRVRKPAMLGLHALPFARSHRQLTEILDLPGKLLSLGVAGGGVGFVLEPRDRQLPPMTIRSSHVRRQRGESGMRIEDLALRR